MFTRNPAGLAALLTFVLSAAMVFAQAPNLGKPVSPAEIAAWDINVLPDGSGLPPGSGTPADGARIYTAKCSACHGPEGKGGPSARLVGGEPVKNMSSEKTIAGFWPYSTTLFDYIRRAMPWQQPRSLTNEEVYALTAYILSQNQLIGERDAMNAQTLPKVRMPNRDGFIVRFPDRTP
ncbi:MAG: cytochrome c [Bryobacterales bacterium]|nr:cytochrome c [Bryobacterales bacterium]